MTFSLILFYSGYLFHVFEGPEAVHDSNDFRKSRLYFEDLDLVYKANRRKLEMIFDVFAKPKVGFSKDKLMTLKVSNLCLGFE